MNTDKIYAESIANEYTVKDTTKVVQLRKLDNAAKRPANIFACTFGVICSLILGVGMCLSMNVIGDGSTAMTVVGIIVGLLGIAGISVNYPIYKKLLAKGKNKYASDIIRLKGETMNKNESKYFNTALLMDEALLCLLEKKEYEFISVKEVCRKAGVNRSTFYLHYEGMDDLLQEAVAMISKRFYAGFGGKKFTDIDNGEKGAMFLITPEYLTPYLSFILQNKRVFRLFYAKPALFGSQRTFEQMYKDMFEPILSRYGVPQANRKYVFEFYAGGLTSMVRRWVESDCDMSIEDFVRLITSLFPYGNDEKK